MINEKRLWAALDRAALGTLQVECVNACECVDRFLLEDVFSDLLIRSCGGYCPARYPPRSMLSMGNVLRYNEPNGRSIKSAGRLFYQTLVFRIVFRLEFPGIAWYGSFVH